MRELIEKIITLKIVSHLFLLGSVFLSWNYFGLFFIYYLLSLIKLFEESKRQKIYIYTLKSLVLLCIWHLGALFWMIPIEKGDGLLGLIGSIIFYLLFFLIIYIVRKKTNLNTSIVIPLWLIFEHLLGISNFSFPWLTVGNVLSNLPQTVQWYEFTGPLGGSLWLWLLALLIYKKKNLKQILIVLFTPLLISYVLLYNKNQRTEEPQIYSTYITINSEKHLSKNPYPNNDKFAFYIKQKLKNMKSEGIVFPEQSFRGVDYANIDKFLFHSYLQELIENEQTKYIHIGATATYKSNTFINAFITITKDSHYLKTKRKLVPYTEYLNPRIKKIIKRKTFDPTVPDSLNTIKRDLQILPLICYESIYSKFVADHSQNTNLIILISSESFFQQSNVGMSQYNNILALRAIENRLPILKASNYGHSILINKNGKVVYKTKEEIGVFKITKEPIHDGTFYIKFTNKYIFHVLLLYTCFLIIMKHIINRNF